jgi:predicted cupin superfamily sugar epimerase
MTSAQDIICALKLAPHPEGGWFRETFRDTRTIDGRAASTAIYYLLARGQRSAWHRIDAAEIWHFYGGAPLLLSLEREGEGASYRLGPDITGGDVPQIVVPEKVWQSAESLGDWTLVGCTVAPGFEFRGFELARKG